MNDYLNIASIFERIPPHMVILSAFNFITIIALVFFERKNPEKVLKWLGVLLFLPFVGFVFYLLFGKGPYLGSRRRVLNKIEKDEKYLKLLDIQQELIGDEKQDDSVADMISFNIKENKSLCSTNNEVELITSVEDFYNELFFEIEHAKSYVHLCFFIIKRDECGKRLIDLLAKKAKEGVSVKLLYDDLGTFKTPKSFFKPIKAAGGEVYKFLPLIVNGLFSLNANYRNHRKIAVIDGKVGYTGGSNIGREYLGKKKRLSPWKDTQVRIKGIAVNMLNIRFMQDFNFASKQNCLPQIHRFDEVANKTTVQIVSDGPDLQEKGIENAYIKAIYEAKKSVWLQTPYLILDEPFKQALITAVKSGIDVKIIIPGKPDKPFVYQSTLSYAEELFEYGVEIYIYEGFIHSKVLVVDDYISSVGTFNLDTRSFKLHFEITAFIYGDSFAKKVKEDFNQTILSCKQMDDTFYKNLPLYDKFLQRLSILFSPLF